MKKTQFIMDREKDVHIQTYCWQPDELTESKAIIQLAHGMAEHIGRYDAFSQFLVEQGFIVYGNDHRGHGASIIAPDDKGFFADKNGFAKVVDDMHALTLHIKQRHPHIPVILFGHSMGSFLSRRYIQLYGTELAGVILSGTGGDPGFMGKVGLLIAKLECRRIGERTPSPLMNKLTFGSFNKAFEPTRTEFDFLSRDESIVEAYIKDDLCGFICSSSFYVDLISGIDIVMKNEKQGNIPKQLPVYLIAGDMDPVGAAGKGVQQIYDLYQQQGLTNVRLTLYPNARHEILNEINNKEVYTDINDWIDSIV